jgi:integrase
MASAAHRLIDSELRSAQPKAKPYNLADARGLYVRIEPNGSKYFRFNCRFNGKQKTLAFGVYPETTLATARRRLDEARELIRKGIDPKPSKAVIASLKPNNPATFQAVAQEWLNGMRKAENDKGWVEAHHVRQVARLEQHAYPSLGNRPIGEITPLEILNVCKGVAANEARGSLTIETANRVLTLIKQVFRHAKIHGLVMSNPADDLAQALPSAKEKHHPAVTTPKELADLLRALHGYSGSPIVQAALKIAPLVFVRPGELRHAKWADIDLEAKEWRFKVTKTDTDHIVPLATQTIDILQALKPLTGHSEYVLHSALSASRPMSDNTVLAAMRRMGIPKDVMTGHGFRATARTILDEVLGEKPEYIEHQLAHAVRDANGRAYNRTSHLAERHLMMQRWADYLDVLRVGGNVVPLIKKVA